MDADKMTDLLLTNGWQQDSQYPTCFYNKGAALYTYPGIGKVKYWPDVRVHSVFYEQQLPITDSDLLDLIAKR
ncbi:hypothetical protein [Spirosoma luteum]|uniref:hypothetical protein n=1 Tax=Spirosoma luteum TaxID=431553 RepID=UPI0003757929|nr:hypothetical protein [Spirosoma luteum]